MKEEWKESAINLLVILIKILHSHSKTAGMGVFENAVLLKYQIKTTSLFDIFKNEVVSYIRNKKNFEMYIDYWFGRMVKTNIEIQDNGYIKLEGIADSSYSSWYYPGAANKIIQEAIEEAIENENIREDFLEKVIAINTYYHSI
jgi:hypothetical protein